MTDEFMYIHNDDTQNYPFCRLQLGIETFGHQSKLTNQSKFNESSKKMIKRCFKTLGLQK